MKKFRITFLIILLLVAIALSGKHIRHFLWKMNQPDIYYVEIEDSRYETHITSAVVSGNQIIRSESNNGINDLSIFTIEQIFQSAYGDCVIEYDSRYHYVSRLAIYDWRSVRVTDFRECKSIQACP